MKAEVAALARLHPPDATQTEGLTVCEDLFYHLAVLVRAGRKDTITRPVFSLLLFFPPSVAPTEMCSSPCVAILRLHTPTDTSLHFQLRLQQGGEKFSL